MWPISESHCLLSAAGRDFTPLPGPDAYGDILPLEEYRRQAKGHQADDY